MVDDLIELLALIPEPSEPAPLWKATLESLAKFSSGRSLKQLAALRLVALQTRRVVESPKANAKAVVLTGKRHSSFCQAALQDRDSDTEE
jgi:hypothetical protein